MFKQTVLLTLIFVGCRMSNAKNIHQQLKQVENALHQLDESIYEGAFQDTNDPMVTTTESSSTSLFPTSSTTTRSTTTSSTITSSTPTSSTPTSSTTTSPTPTSPTTTSSTTTSSTTTSSTTTSSTPTSSTTTSSTPTSSTTTSSTTTNRRTCIANCKRDFKGRGNRRARRECKKGCLINKGGRYPFYYGQGHQNNGRHW